MSAAARALAERQQQGLSERITDPATLARVVALLRHAAAPKQQESRHQTRDAA